MKETKNTVPDSQDKKGFRLLGIKTGDRIDISKPSDTRDHLKALKANEYYPFYACYEYDLKSGIFTYHPELDVDLYSYTKPGKDNQPNRTAIHISAVLGKNGTGKSTLTELLFLAIHNISCICQILKDPEDGSPWPFEMGVHLELFYVLEETIYCYRVNDMDVMVSTVTKSNDTNVFPKFEKFHEATKADLEHFFYTVAINYSLYGLNTRHIGDWIRALFHKNDAYQTPVVLNPMRDRGNIDVNREEYLSKSRLLANLLVMSDNQEHLKLTDKQQVVDLWFEINRKKIRNLYEIKRGGLVEIEWTFDKLFSAYDEENGRDSLLSEIYEHYIGFNRKEVASNKFIIEIEQYIVKKLFRIAWIYDKYKKYLDDYDGILAYPNPSVYGVKENPLPKFYSEGEYSFVNYLKELKKDKSHITFKLNQAVNYLSNEILSEDSNHKWAEENQTPTRFEIPVKELAKRINTSNPSEIINFIPPSLFDCEIILEEIGNPKQRTFFGNLSSGEQQMIQSVQSILYHVINLNSVFENGTNDDLKYRYLNIVFDEVELYFHPEFQRNFIANLLDKLKKLDIEHIYGINLLFSTHSPFILSDIPGQNILRLELNEERKSEPQPMKEQTFGANIYDLLKNDFFLTKGFIGQYSIDKIKEIINYTENGKYDSEKHFNYERIVDLIGDEIIQFKLKQLLLEVIKTEDKDLAIAQLIKRRDILDEQIKRMNDDNNSQKDSQ